MTSERWCQQQTGALGKLKVDTSVIAAEFKVSDLDTLQDVFRDAFRKSALSRTFPGVGFFRNSFETARIRALYDVFLAFPEPDILAAIIQLSRSNDDQEKGDALMALVFLHLQAPNLSVSGHRWREVFAVAEASDHFTMLAFRGRLYAFGEFRAKDLRLALADLRKAASLPLEYKQSEGRKDFDTQNYETLPGLTAREIYQAEPNAPFRNQWQGALDLARQAEDAQNLFSQQIPSMRIGKLYADANRLNQEAVNLGDSIIVKSQGGNQLAGQLAGLKSLRSSAPGDRPVFEDISPDLQVEQLKMFAKLESIDSDQKALLVQAQEKRLLAQGVLAQSYGEIAELMLSHIRSMNIMGAVAARPVLTQVNNSLIQSCSISAKWEQAMRVRDVPVPNRKKTESDVVDLQSKYKD